MARPRTSRGRSGSHYPPEWRFASVRCRTEHPWDRAPSSGKLVVAARCTRGPARRIRPPRKHFSTSERMSHLYLILVIALAGFALLFTVQNVAAVDVTFLVWTISMSRALLILFTLSIGFLLEIGRAHV